MAFGDNVRRKRDARDMTQEELAEKTDLALRNIQRIEAGELNILVTTVMRLCRALDATPNQLISLGNKPGSKKR